MSFLGCLKHYIFPPQLVISVMILEIPLCMHEDGVVHPLCSIDPFSGEHHWALSHAVTAVL